MTTSDSQRIYTYLTDAIPLRATPKALRYGRGSLLCTMRISPNSTQRGQNWKRNGGHGWMRIDTVVGDNPRAIHAYLRAGFSMEGLMPRAVYVDGRYQDVTAMGLLRPLD